MKKLTASLLVFTFVFSALFSGCAMTEAKAIKRYKESFEKMEKMEQYTMETDMTFGMEVSGLKIDIDMDMDSAVAENGKKSSHTINLSILGQKESLQVYQDSDDIYTTIPGVEGKYLKQSGVPTSDSADVKNLTEISGVQQSLAYIEAIDKAADVTFEEKEDKSLVVAFDFTEESLERLRKEVVDTLEKQAITMMKEQIHEQFEDLPLPEDAKKQLEDTMLNVYRNIFSNIKIDSIHTERTISKDGYPIEEHLTMQITMDISQLFAVLGEEVDPATKESMKNIELSIDLCSRISNINQEINVEFPEFTEENTLTSKEMLDVLD